MKRKSKRPAAQMCAKVAMRKTRPKSSSAIKRAHLKSSREKVRSHRERERLLDEAQRLSRALRDDSREQRLLDELERIDADNADD